MQGPLVGDKQVGVDKPTSTPEKSRFLTRFAAAVASPLGVLLVVPGIVLAIGTWLTVIGQRALASSSLELGLDQVTLHNALVARQIGLALAQADTLLQRLRSLASVHTPASPLAHVAFPMRDLMLGRPGVAYVSMSFPDGTFQGAYLEEGKVLFQDSRVGANGTTVLRFSTEKPDQLVRVSVEQSNYDPRTRGFYAIALSNSGAAWTQPYPFFKTHYTGITRTEAVRGADGAVRAVLTVDFDVNELSRHLEQNPLADSRVLLYAKDGTLLADPAAKARIRALPVFADRPLRFQDLKDPVLDAFFASSPTGDLSSFSVDGRRYLVHRQSVGDRALDWHVASFVPEDLLLAPARRYQGRAATVALLSVLVAAGMAVLFSRHIVRMRRQTAEARAAATRAIAQAKELGSYRLTERIGAGGMGEVWRAEHRLLARQAAIKLIRPESNAGPDAQERFRREAQTLATLRSRHTIDLFDYGITEDGTFFYVMELLDGMDLETLVGRYGPQPPARVVSLLMQACSSLAEAHASGLVHRDIKPANLYVCRAADEVDVLKVLDFGLVRSLADVQSPSDGRSIGELVSSLGADSQPLSKLTAAGAVMGTPDYMAPEQILGREIDARADVYALGGVAHFALCGEPPYPGHKDSMNTMLAHVLNEVPNLAARLKGIPEPLAELVARCMAKRPEDRPASVSAVRAELSAIEFPDAERWTDDDALDWWSRNVPRSSLRPSILPLSSTA